MSKLRTLIKHVEIFEKLSLYGTSSSFLKKISQEMSKMPPTEPLMTPDPRPAVLSPQVKPQAKPRVKIPEGIQAALNRLGYPIPLQQDNILGQETQKALNWFSDTYKIPFTGPAIYANIMSEANKKRLNPTLPDLDPAAKQQADLATHPDTGLKLN